MPYWVYVLRSSVTNRRYTGSCEDLDRRLHEHNTRQSKATRHGAPWEIVHVESFSTRAEAIRRERALKTGRGRAELDAILSTRLESPAMKKPG